MSVRRDTSVLTRDRLQASLDRFSLGRLLDARLASGGVNRQSVLLRTSSGCHVLRGWPVHPLQWDKERLHARLIHEHTRLRPPWPYLVDHASDLFGWPYAITGEVRGTSGADAALWKGATVAERAQLAEAFGRGLGELHALSRDGHGEFDPEQGDVVTASDSFADWAIARIEAQLAQCTAGGRRLLDDADASWVRAVVADNRAALTPPAPAVFVHHDFTLDNVFFVRDDAGWRVAGVIDLAEGYFGDGEEDLVRTLASFGPRHRERIADFLRGYLSVRSLRPQAAQRYRVYILADRLAVWLHSRLGGLRVPEGLTFRRFAEPLLGLRLF